MRSKRLLGAALWMLALVPCARGEIRILAVTSSTNFTFSPLLPGSLGTLFCTGLTGISGVVTAGQTPLPRTLAGVSVRTLSAGGTFDAPILAVADLGTYQQINFQVPWEGNGVVIVSQGLNQAIQPYVIDRGWAVFFENPSGYVVAQHASDYSLVTLDKPARAGEWISAYASNLGPVQNTPPTGSPAALDRLSPLAISAPVLNFALILIRPGMEVRAASNFMGLAPGTVGVYQVNFLMPDGWDSTETSVLIEQTKDCGFFFTHGCGRGIVKTRTLAAKLPTQ